MRMIEKAQQFFRKRTVILLLIMSSTIILNPPYIFATCHQGADCSTVGEVKSDPTYCDITGCSDEIRVCQSDGWSACYCRECTTDISCTAYFGSYLYGGFKDCEYGVLDTYCECVANQTISFYNGQSGTQNVGICHGGTYTCYNGYSYNYWYTSTSEVTPQTEVCDGLDNDCDGQTDEVCECVVGTPQDCYTPGGEPLADTPCKKGLQTCEPSGWGDCIGEVTPQTEICDGTDNNCNGSKDEVCECVVGTTQWCYTPGGQPIAPCLQGMQTCYSSGWGACDGEITPQLEKCDQIDNDCDGQIDDGPGTWGACDCNSGDTAPCYNGAGGLQQTLTLPCKFGEKLCTNGLWGECGGEIQPRTEICDKIDNNCDGTVDNVLDDPCCGRTKCNCEEGVGK